MDIRLDYAMDKQVTALTCFIAQLSILQRGLNICSLPKYSQSVSEHRCVKEGGWVIYADSKCNGILLWHVRLLGL